MTWPYIFLVTLYNVHVQKPMHVAPPGSKTCYLSKLRHLVVKIGINGVFQLNFIFD